jgi:hypothetical protein
MTSHSRLAWRLHLGVLGALAVAFGAYVWHVSFKPPETGSLDLALDRLGIAIGLFVLPTYAAVTSAIMLWACRWRWSPVVIHGAVALALWVNQAHKEAARAERDARYRAEHADEIREDEERERLATCVHVAALRVRLGPPLRAVLTVANRGCPTVTLEDVDLSGFRDGRNWILRWDRDDRTPLPLADGARIDVPVEDSLAPFEDLADDVPQARDGWAWRSNVSLAERLARMQCFATVDAPDPRGCRGIEAVTVTPGR